MKNLTITLCLLVCANLLFAQPEVIWSEAFGGGQGDQGLGIIQNDEGNIIVVGNEGSFGGGGTDGWIMALDTENGEEIWSSNFGGNGYDRFRGVIQIDGGYVVSGYEGSFGAGQFDFWLKQIDDEGGNVWERAFGGREHERADKLIQTENGGYIFVGATFSFGEGEDDGWVIATDNEGNQEWTSVFGGNGRDGFSDLCHADEGNILVAGRTSEGEGGFDILLAKINSEGEEVWTQTYGGEEDDQCNSMVRTDDDCYVMAGTTVSFGENGSDFWLIKINEDGEVIWSRTFNDGANDLCRSVIQTVDNGYLMLGHNDLYNDASCDAWIVRTDEEGEELWSETYGGDQADVGVDVVQLTDGGYAFIGWTSSIGAGGLDMWVVRLGPEPAGVLQGFVLNAANDDPLEGAAITTTNGLSAETNEDGFFIIEPAWAGDFEMTASIPGYNDSTLVDLSLEFEDTLEVEFSLLHPEFEPSRESFEMELEIDDSHEFDFNVENNGNGPLEYQVEKRLLGDANAEPFEMRRTDELEELLEDDRLAGAVFVDGYFYISGGNGGGNDQNKIYVLNIDREVVREFDQFNEDDRYGMRDLTFDGELIWGAVEGTFYGFTTEGDLVTEFEVDADVEGRAIAWDAENELLWVTDISEDIFGINCEGEVIRTVENEDLRIYGLSYWIDDPDGYDLYIFCRGPDNEGISVFKLDLENGDYMEAAFFNVEGRPSGLQITNQLDVYSWVMVALVQNTDALNIWQLEGRKEWFEVNPDEGVIEAGESHEFTLTLNSTGLPPDNLFRGEAVFMHNAIQAETALSVSLRVVEGQVQTSREIEFHIGWNTVSTNLQPNDHENIEGLVAPLVENNLLIMMKNGSGDFYRPEYEFNNIPGWYSYEGYQVLLAGAATLELEGLSMLRDDPIDLTEGWQLISYYPRFEVEATLALSGIVDHLVIAKDGYGNFYLPAWDHFSNMGNMREGQGYFLNMDADVELVYVTREEEEERLMSGADIPVGECKTSRTNIPVCQSDKAWLSELKPTETSYSLLLLTEGLASGTRLEAYSLSGELAGRGVVGHDGRCGMALWGFCQTRTSDSTPNNRYDGYSCQTSGFSEGEAITISIACEADIPAYQSDLEWLDGETSGWKADGWGVARLTGLTEVPVEFGIVSAYPNPFNSTTKITYSLPEATVVNLKLFDISGREVATIVGRNQKAGIHEATIKADALSSGLYFLRLEASGQIQNRKVILIK